jgi:hypothetical protein
VDWEAVVEQNVMDSVYFLIIVVFLQVLERRIGLLPQDTRKPGEQPAGTQRYTRT